MLIKSRVIIPLTYLVVLTYLLTYLRLKGAWKELKPKTMALWEKLQASILDK